MYKCQFWSYKVGKSARCSLMMSTQLFFKTPDEIQCVCAFLGKC